MNTILSQNLYLVDATFIYDEDIIVITNIAVTVACTIIF